MVSAIEDALADLTEAEGAGPRETLPGVTMICGQDGARRHDLETYRRDAAVLERALQSEIDPFLVSRYTFYLAQSLRDTGDRNGALTLYLARADLGFWAEEVYVSLLNAARLMIALDWPPEEIMAVCDRAATLCPHRAEIFHEVSRFLRLRDRFEEAYQVAAMGSALPLPAAGLFLEPAAYRYALLDELGISAYRSGRYRESLMACLDILGNDRAPAEHRDRTVANARFAAERLAA